MADDFTKRVRVYYDAEFTGLHRDTTLISIGMVSSSGAYFYAEFDDYDRSQVSDWLKENIIDKLVFGGEDRPVHQIREFRTNESITARSPGHPEVHYNMMLKGPTEFIKANLLNWLRRESDAEGGQKIQFYTDCYAYDWVLLNHLICPGGDAMQLPDYLDYIPVDLSTALLIKGIDPDITREDYADSNAQEVLKKAYPFNKMGEALKHNCLWDAVICRNCFHKLESGEQIVNGGIYSPESVQKAWDKIPDVVKQRIIESGGGPRY